MAFKPNDQLNIYFYSLKKKLNVFLFNANEVLRRLYRQLIKLF